MGDGSRLRPGDGVVPIGQTDDMMERPKASNPMTSSCVDHVDNVDNWEQVRGAAELVLGKPIAAMIADCREKPHSESQMGRASTP